MVNRLSTNIKQGIGTVWNVVKKKPLRTLAKIGIGLGIVFIGYKSLEQTNELKYSFKIPVSGGYNARGFGAGDIDGDGDLDLISSNNYGKLFMHINDGKGNYTTRNEPLKNIEIPTGGGYHTRALAVGDYDGDGDQDILSSNRYGELIIYYNGKDFAFPSDL